MPVEPLTELNTSLNVALRVLGLASIDDVDPELALETIDSLIVLGALRVALP